MPHPLRSVLFGALVLGGLTSCGTAANSSTRTTLAPLTTAFATMPPVTAPPTTLPGETTTIAPGAPVDYTVQSGDYLYKIANDHGVSAQDIATLNGWSSINHALQPGVTIKVPAGTATGGETTDTAPPTGDTAPPTGETTSAPPTGGASSTTTTTTKAPSGGSSTSTTKAPVAGGTSYTVKDGDTVYGLANKNGITPQDLVAANGWSDVTHNLFPGDKIVIPEADD